MSKTFNTLDLIIIASLLWHFIKAFAKVLIAAIILVTIAFFIAEILTNA